MVSNELKHSYLKHGYSLAHDYTSGAAAAVNDRSNRIELDEMVLAIRS
jgi:hypothetical protein